ncbi:copper amine oxidase N-terminal domain-containing protein [Paenibacillus sp. SC116]|nr:copper amine oxidase N-terminal domain-containing protein [Paenibacillus sp. SC116]
MVQIKSFKDPVKLMYSYEQATKTIIIINKEKKLTVRLNGGAKTAQVNAKSVPVTIKDGRTYLPLRFLSEPLGGTVEFSVV